MVRKIRKTAALALAVVLLVGALALPFFAAGAESTYDVLFVVDGAMYATITKNEGDPLRVSDFPAVPSKADCVAAWDTTEDLYAAATVTAVYARIVTPEEFSELVARIEALEDAGYLDEGAVRALLADLASASDLSALEERVELLEELPARIEALENAGYLDEGAVRALLADFASASDLSALEERVGELEGLAGRVEEIERSLAAIEGAYLTVVDKEELQENIIALKNVLELELQVAVTDLLRRIDEGGGEEVTRALGALREDVDELDGVLSLLAARVTVIEGDYVTSSEGSELRAALDAVRRELAAKVREEVAAALGGLDVGGLRDVSARLRALEGTVASLGTALSSIDARVGVLEAAGYLTDAQAAEKITAATAGLSRAEDLAAALSRLSSVEDELGRLTARVGEIERGTGTLWAFTIVVTVLLGMAVAGAYLVCFLSRKRT